MLLVLRWITPLAFVTLVVAAPNLFAADPVAELEAYLQQADGNGGGKKLAEQPFAAAALSKDQSAAAAQLLWDAHRQRIRRERAEEMKARQVPTGATPMKFAYQVFGDKPAGGRSLYLSLHGGGGAPPQVNDSQWKNQQRLYQPEEGIYLAPRAPADSWNLWHIAAVDAGFDRLIENLIVFEQVDPNRVYLMGYSAGGDGVYQVAPRMADRFAAASMMAGHPNEASPRGLRNLPFSIHVGENDGAYNRNRVAAEWGERIAKLKQVDADGYEHWVKIHAGKGHWMDRDDRAAVPWMAKFTRDPLPKRIVWEQDDVTHTRFYWLAVEQDQTGDRAVLTAERDGQTIDLASEQVERVTVRLNDAMLDLDQPVTIRFNGKQVFAGKVERTIATLARTLAERGDPTSLFSAEVTVDSP